MPLFPFYRSRLFPAPCFDVFFWFFLPTSARVKPTSRSLFCRVMYHAHRSINRVLFTSFWWAQGSLTGTAKPPRGCRGPLMRSVWRPSYLAAIIFSEPRWSDDDTTKVFCDWLIACFRHHGRYRPLPANKKYSNWAHLKSDISKGLPLSLLCGGERRRQCAIRPACSSRLAQ